MLMTTPSRILLVDDDDVDRDIVRRALHNAELPFELEEARDGKTAIESFAHSRFDYVILDYHLPDRTGADVFRAISQSSSAKAAVIFLTSEDNEEVAYAVMEAGAVDYLNKNDLAPGMLRRSIRYARARQNFLLELAAIGRRDALTGLPNRSVFNDSLTNAIAQCGRSGTMVAALLLDLDNFKDVNDTLGHPAGDMLLNIVAERLRQSTRETDTVIRLGGDEFVIIAPNLRDEQGAIRLAEKILESMAQWATINQHQIHISTSIGIGIALAPHDGRAPDKVLKSADLALYKAKNEGRGRYCFYDKSMDAAAHIRSETEKDLRLALERGEFELYYQPKVMAENGAVLGVEALLRWHHPERGIVYPGSFIPMAERGRFILPIGEWVLRTAAAQMVAWKEQGVPVGNCSVNLSPVQLADPKLIEKIDDAIGATGVDPSCMEVEITEGSLMHRINAVSEKLQQLRNRGISVSVDDFGTGYSSLNHLRQLPLDKLKVDRSFVTNILINTEDAEITNTIVSLGKSIGLDVIAEGVETLGQVNLLREFGCDQVQGYYYNRPLPANCFAEWCRNWNAALPKSE
jgi:diguanylate cyclase (GGDEF)-like protein